MIIGFVIMVLYKKYKFDLCKGSKLYNKSISYFNKIIL